MKVILAFQHPADSLKLQSAYFLIQYLENNYSIWSSLIDSSGNIVEINPEDFPDYPAIKKYRDSIENISGKLSYRADSIWLDIYNINSGFLIEHINTAFNTWKKSPWDINYDFNTFCEYILPYRVANEKIEPTAKHFQEKYMDLLKHNIIETAKLLNNEINNELSYDERLVINPIAQLITITEQTRTGNLLDINIYKVAALRSLGIAAALDYTPFFADSILGYYSTTVILPNSDKLILTRSESQSTPYSQGNVAKVYRRSFKNDPHSLFSIKGMETHTPPFLGNYNYLDVTDEYVQTADVTFDFADTSQFIYLAVFNDCSWQPVEWSRAGIDCKAKFTNMGTDVNYMPIIVSDDRVIPVGQSFYLID
ncbi:MAG: hypothetical protein H8E34_08895 [Bacteroidetes bacterium]|nr:hypothetical protein [Bacteroidota bacterium]MBL6944824.1 hypothetical protein [Bacteroidales bacterium]